jgi:hypothetical protein
MPKRKSDKDRERLLLLIDEATIDCYGEEEQHTGILTMIEDNVECPFQAKVIGEKVVVTGFEWPKAGYGLFAVCERNGRKYRVEVNSLEYTKPLPVGFEWIEAYFAWREGVG